MNPENNKIKYIPGFDGMRGMAILLVMLFHTGIPYFKGGFIGVDIFFVLSGFLITSLLIKEQASTGRINLKHFYLRRVLRLAPALLLLLLTVAISGIALGLKGSSSTDLSSVLITLFYSANWVRAFNLHPMGILAHTWSLSIEEQFYMLWPLFVIMLLKLVKSKKEIFNIVFTLSILSWLLRIYLTQSGFPAERIYNGLDTRADGLLIGCLAAIMHNSPLQENWFSFGTKRYILLKNLAFAGFTFPFIILFNISWRNVNMFYWINFLVEIFTAALILHVISNKKSLIKKLLTFKPLIWTGSISYGIYLWHDPVYEVMRSYGFSKLSILVLGSIITFAIATASYYIMEKPVLSLKKKLQAKSSDLTTAKPAASANSVMAEEYK